MLQVRAPSEQQQQQQQQEVEEEAEELSEAVPDGGLAQAGSARALLSRRSCPNCVCFAEDAARCGYSVIKDAAKCGVQVTKMCKMKKWKLKCNFKETAKSCRVANKCKFTSSFSDCLGDICSNFNGQGKDFMKMVTKTGCTSVSSCKKQVTDGLSDAWKRMRSEIMSGGKAVFSRTGVSKVGDMAVKVYNEARDITESVGSEAEAIGAEVMKYITGQLSAWEKYDLGRVCAPEGRGFWYLYPSDCGAFSSMGKIFSDMDSASRHFGDTRRALGTCVSLKGLLGVPTPFIKVGWTHFCLYQPIVTAMEYLIGGMSFAAAGAAALISNVRAVVDELNGLASNLGLVQMAKELHAHRRSLQGGGNGTEPQVLMEGDDCGPDPSWSVKVGLGWSASYTNPEGKSVGFGLGTGLVVGCKDGKLLPPNWLLTVEFVSGIQFINEPERGVKTGFSVGLAFAASYPTFTRRTSVGMSLTIAPEVNLNTLTGGSIPISAGVPVAFSLLPDPNHPTAFAISIEPAADSGFLQFGREAHGASEAASRRALESGENPALAAIAGSFHAVAGRRSELRAALAQSLKPRSEILEQAKLVDQHKQVAAATLIERAQRRLAGTDGTSADTELGALQESAVAADFPVEIGLSSTVGFAFCITPTECFGS